MKLEPGLKDTMDKKSTFGVDSWEIGKLYMFTSVPTLDVRDYRSWIYGSHVPKLFTRGENRLMSVWQKQAEHAYKAGNVAVRHQFKTKDCFMLLGHGKQNFTSPHGVRENIEFIRVLVQGKDCMLSSRGRASESFADRGFIIERYNG